MALGFLIRTSVKLGIVGGAVYVTYDQGVWGEPEQSIAAYHRLLNRLPDTKNYRDKLGINITSNMPVAMGSVSEYWNKGVQFTFGALAAAPCTILKYSQLAFRKAENTIKDSLK